jgi:EpsI family protein
MTHATSELHPRLARSRLWCGLICAAAGAAIFQFLGNSTRGYIGTASLFGWWGFQWVNPDSETQHGLLILGISVWLLVRNLGSEPSGSTGGGFLPAAVGAMVGGLLLHAAGFVAEQARLSILGLLLYTWGVLGFAGGRRWARASLFPLAFMVFAIPLNALDSAGFWLRMYVVSASAWITHGLGIKVLVNGTQLLSADGRYDYDVAAACSGVRSLVALTALSLLIGYLRFRPPWLRAAMFMLCFPLVFLGNVVRIVTIIIAAQLGGQAWGDRLHEVMGFGVFAIVLGGVLAAAEVVARLRPEWSDQAPARIQADPSARSADPDLEYRCGQRPWIGAACTALAAALTALFLVHVSEQPARGRVGVALEPDGLGPVELPSFIGTDWIGRRTEVTAVERQVLPADTGFSRKIYISVADPSVQVFLSIVLSGRDRTSIHRPELCLVGQGWTIRGSFAHEFEFPGHGSGFPATVLRVEKEVLTEQGRRVVPQLVAYYFVGGDVVVATHWDRIMRDAWNRVAHGRADRWAYVLIQTGEPEGEDEALKRIQAILDGTVPMFQRAG